MKADNQGWRQRRSWSSAIKIIYLLVAKYQDEHIYRRHHNWCCLSSTVLEPGLYCDVCIWSLFKLACEGTFVAIAMFSEMTQLRTADRPNRPPPHRPPPPVCTRVTEWQVFTFLKLRSTQAATVWVIWAKPWFILSFYPVLTRPAVATVSPLWGSARHPWSQSKEQAALKPDMLSEIRWQDDRGTYQRLDVI